MPASASSLPRVFCWSRFGTEAGEAIDAILSRKEAERQSNGGVFFWGIGNSVGPAIAELLERTAEPEVLFSPIRSRPRQADTTPGHVVRWTVAEGLLGAEAFDVPAQAHVTSRWDPARPSAAHYALVCASVEPLRIADAGWLRFGALRNLRSGARLGASQVTAVVRRADALEGGALYRVAFRAALVAPYFVRLREPMIVDGIGTQPVSPQHRSQVRRRRPLQNGPTPLPLWSGA